jgi:hypothetical protein
VPFVTILVCGGCRTNLDQTDAEDDRAAIEHEARLAKWTQDHRGEWYCPTCSLAVPYRHERPEKFRLALTERPSEPAVVQRPRARKGCP